MTYDHQLVLIGERVELDDMGQEIPAETRIEILCAVKSVGRAEFYGAATAGLRPEIVFVIHECEYNDERQVEFDSEKYKVIRTYRGGMARQGTALAHGEMELTCERVVGNG